MSTFLGEFIHDGCTVKRYRADTTPEQQEEIIRGVLTVCAKAKLRKQQEEEGKNVQK